MYRDEGTSAPWKNSHNKIKLPILCNLQMSSWIHSNSGYTNLAVSCNVIRICMLPDHIELYTRDDKLSTFNHNLEFTPRELGFQNPNTLLRIPVTSSQTHISRILHPLES